MRDEGKPENYPVMRYRGFRLFAVTLVRIAVRLFLRLNYTGLENLPSSGPAIQIGRASWLGTV